MENKNNRFSALIFSNEVMHRVYASIYKEAISMLFNSKELAEDEYPQYCNEIISFFNKIKLDLSNKLPSVLIYNYVLLEELATKLEVIDAEQEELQKEENHNILNRD